jgi:Glycoside hydrolase 123, catalytic domain
MTKISLPLIALFVMSLFMVSQTVTASDAAEPVRITVLHSAASWDVVAEGQPAEKVSLQLAQGEAEHAQVVLQFSPDLSGKHIEVSLSPLESTDDGGEQTIAADINLPVITLRELRSVADVRDALVPVKDSIVVESEQSTVLWVTVRSGIKSKAGDYRGQLSISGDGVDVINVPITVEVWPVSIPQSPSMPAVMGINGAVFKGEKEARAESLASWMEFFLDYRTSPYICDWVESSMVVDTSFTPWGIEDKRTEALLRDPRMTAAAIPYHGLSDDDFKAWVDLAGRISAKEKLFLYLWDEPTEHSQYAELDQWASRIHAIDPGLRVLTSYYRGPKTDPGTDDIFAMPELLGSSTQIHCLSTWAAKGDEGVVTQLKDKLTSGQEMWTYVCMGPGNPHPNLFIDMTGIQHRAVMWRAWKEQGEGFLYWAVNAYVGDSAMEGPVFRPELPAGDGILAYPGELFDLPGQPIASVRLERWRDGMEDLELLTLHADRFGRDSTIAVLNQVYQGPSKYTDDAVAVEVFREQLASELLGIDSDQDR